MATETFHSHELFSWVDLKTTDVAGAGDFYSSLFAWKKVSMEAVPPAAVCDMFLLHDVPVAALFAQKFTQKFAQKNEGMPPVWDACVSVSSAAEAAQRAEAAGGAVLCAPYDVGNGDQAAVIADPAGAAINVLCGGEGGNDVVMRQDEVGAPCWYELSTNNRDAAADFYQAVFGWNMVSFGDGAEAGQDPSMGFSLDGEGILAGVKNLENEIAEFPPHWSVYFGVLDCDEVVAAAVKLGGKVLISPTPYSPSARYARLFDPQGGMFCIAEVCTAEVGAEAATE